MNFAAIASRKLIVTASVNMSDETYGFPCYEFENGAIMVPSDTNNRFFDSCEEIVASGGDSVVSVEETGKVREWELSSIQELIKGSEREFGCDAGKIKELIERPFVSNRDSWEVFAGGITPDEFMLGFDSPEAAVKDYLGDGSYPFDEKPSWLEESLIRYIEDHAESTILNGI
jgi:hypothetical protein